MTLRWGTTNQVTSHGVKILTYGLSGAGKTGAISTLPAPVVASAESGLMPLRKMNIRFAEIKTLLDIIEFYMWCKSSHEATQYASIAIDSLSEIAEVVLANELKLVKDPRQAYGEIITKMTSLVRDFRDLPGKNVYMSAKAEFTKDDQGRMFWLPMMPGNKLGQQLPYFFDEVFYMHTQEWEGKKYHLVQTHQSGQIVAKDRSGALQPVELADLGMLINKILGV